MQNLKSGLWEKNREFEPGNPVLHGFSEHSEHGFVKIHYLPPTPRYAHLNNRLKSHGDHNRGDCGIEISNLQQSDFGVWKCRVQRVRQERTDSLHLCVDVGSLKILCLFHTTFLPNDGIM